MISSFTADKESISFKEIYEYGTREPKCTFFLYRIIKSTFLVRFLLYIHRHFTSVCEFENFLQNYMTFLIFEAISNSVRKTSSYENMSLLVLIQLDLKLDEKSLYNKIKYPISKIRYISYIHNLFNTMAIYKEETTADRPCNKYWNKLIEKISKKLDRKKYKIVFPTKEYIELISTFIKAAMYTLFEKEKSEISMILRSKTSDDMQQRYKEVMTALVPQKCDPKMHKLAYQTVHNYISKQLNGMSNEESELTKEIMPTNIYKEVILKIEAETLILKGFQEIIKNPSKSESIMISITMKVNKIYNPIKNRYSVKKHDNADLIDSIKSALEKIGTPKEKQLIRDSLSKSIRRSLILNDS
ncbi:MULTISPECIES: hypothetical protein [Candidatus Ichthyocystis]|uniref:Uncharacterized protein n=1 Tax=Candidatus Ichthyocystis hellenicum TaxID=1561003 RepID=A0A0S4M6A3_9BURK|nr:MULTISPECIES: hypothetical protein [Ichthyocystis]CUT17789.1 hypothetical protein Ark11_0969 [Candidatus Ichthyocystis hellenicum]